METNTRFQQFIRERQYLSNVSDNTVRWYKHAFKWLPGEHPTEAECKAMVLRMRERGLKPSGANAAIRAINAYLKWSGAGFKITKLKEPVVILPTFTDAQVKLLIGFRPRSTRDRRLHLLVLLLLDTGCRISEALGLRPADLDFDNLLIKLHGKGNKDRIVPMSLELRKVFWRYKDEGFWPGKRVGALRAVKGLCRRLGFEPPIRTLHCFRRTFATCYVKRGGSVFHLQRALGHSSLTMSMRYSNLLTEDLQQTHAKVSLLGNWAA